MKPPRLSRGELRIMEALWTHGACSVREIQETFAEKDQLAYTTVQTMVARLETKQAVRKTKKIGNAHIFEAAVTRSAAQGRLVDEMLRFFGGRVAPLMSHLVDTGRLTLRDVEEARTAIKKSQRKE
jgi:BlaI family transcriptional regulator, penicillinase repressor